MKKLADLSQNKDFKEKLQQSFIPYSHSLSKAWTIEGDKQAQWGALNASAIFTFDSKLSPLLTVKGVFLKAAAVRQQIEHALRGNPHYAQPRFDNTRFYPHTVLNAGNRYGDQFNEGLNALTALLKNDSACASQTVYFQMKGHPDSMEKRDGPYIKVGDEPHLLMVEAYQHYLEYQGRKIKLTAVRNYQWVREEVRLVAPFFDVVNSFDCDLDAIFDYLQRQQVNVWEDRPDLTDTQFYEKLGELMWFFAQSTPLKEGSAATSMFIMKYCLIKRFGENAPIFVRPGLSIDLLAMLTTRQDFTKSFQNLLRKDRPTHDEIEQGKNMDLNAETAKAMERKAIYQIYMGKTDQHITEDLRESGLFRVIDDDLVLGHAYDQDIKESTDSYAQYHQNLLKQRLT